MWIEPGGSAGSQKTQGIPGLGAENREWALDLRATQWRAGDPGAERARRICTRGSQIDSRQG